MSSEVGRQRNSSAEAEQNAEAVHDHVHDGNGKLVDECCGEEVQQREQPPYTNEQCVVDDGVGAVSGARNVVASHGCNNYSTDELYRY